MIAVEQHPVAAKVGDAVAIGITLGAFLEYLPAIAALLSIVWLMLQMTRFCLNWYRDEKRRRGQRRRRGETYGQDSA